MTAANLPVGEVVSVNLAVVRDNPARRVHEPVAAEPVEVNSEPVNSEPVDGKPVNSEPVDGKPTKTGIDKRPATGPVMVRWLGLSGDTICDTANHGGLDQAVYAYAEHDTEWWQEQLVDELPFRLGPGSLGENLTVRGVDLSGAVIGERWQIGEVILHVSVPRIPCSVFAAYWSVPRLVKRFTQANRTGAYLRVLAEGELQAGDPVTVLDRPAHGLTVRETLRALTGDRSLAAKLLTAPELPAGVHEAARHWLATARELVEPAV